MQSTSSERIKDNMMRIGDRFSELIIKASQDDGTKRLQSLSRMFNIAERAYGMVVKVEKLEFDQMTQASEETLEQLISVLSRRIKRSRAYEAYIDFCYSIGYKNPLSRNSFYKLLRSLDFEDRKISGERHLLPPANGGSKLKEEFALHHRLVLSD